MARKKKSTTISKKNKLENVLRTTQIKLANIANKLGTNVDELLASYGDAQTIIEKFDSGSLSLLTEEEEEEEEEESIDDEQ